MELKAPNTINNARNSSKAYWNVEYSKFMKVKKCNSSLISDIKYLSRSSFLPSCFSGPAWLLYQLLPLLFNFTVYEAFALLESYAALTGS